MPSRARVCMERACARVIVCDSRCVKEQERRSCRVARRGEVEGREIDRPQDALESFLDTKMAEKIVRSSTSRAATFFFSPLFSPIFFLLSFFFLSPLSSAIFLPPLPLPLPLPPTHFSVLILTIWMANLDRCKKTWWCGNRKRLGSWLVALQRFDEKRWMDGRMDGRFSTSRNSIRCVRRRCVISRKPRSMRLLQPVLSVFRLRSSTFRRRVLPLV